MIHSLACDYERLALVLACTLFLSYQLRALIRAFQKEARNMSKQLEALTAAVAAERTVVSSAVTLLTSLKSKLDEAINAEDPEEALESLSDEIGSQTAALASAVALNTPSAVSGSEATSNTASPAPADLPDGHPLKPAAEAPPADEPAPAT